MRAEITASAFALAYNVALHRLLPQRGHLLSNLAAAGLLLGFARREGVSSTDLGLHPQHTAGGARLGLTTIAPIAAAVGLGVALPATRPLFADEQIASASRGETLYHALVRIPLATALAEELIFRGALTGLFLQRRPPAQAAALSSALFGLWHVLPTLDTFDDRTAAAVGVAVPWHRPAAAAGVVATTSVAGGAFAWLRLRSGSVLAPVLAHTAVNAVSLLAARRAGRWSR